MAWTKQRLNNLFFIIGIAACVVMLLTFDVSFVELWHHLEHAGYWLIPIVGVWLPVYALNALSWQSVIRGNLGTGATAGTTTASAGTTATAPAGTPADSSVGHRLPSFWRILRLTITGYALNYATPVGGLGGEPYRIMELSRDIDREHATSSVILYAMMHFVGHFLFWFVSIWLYIALAAAGDVPMTPVVAVVMAAGIAFCLFFFYVFSRGYKNGAVKYILGVVARVPGLKRWTLRFWARHAAAIENIDRQIASLHGQNRRAFYRSLALEFLSRVVQSAEVLFMLLLFGIDCGGGLGGILLTYLHSILIVAFTTLFANLIGFLPMQLGVQEGGFVISIAALGLSAALGIFVSIICRVREIIWIAIGMALMKMSPSR